MKKHWFAQVAIALVIIILVAAAVFRPSKSYDMTTDTLPKEVVATIQQVEDLLEDGYLPTWGTQIQRQNDELTWVGLSEETLSIRVPGTGSSTKQFQTAVG